MRKIHPFPSQALQQRAARERDFARELKEAMDRADVLAAQVDALCDPRHGQAFQQGLGALIEATTDGGQLGAVAAKELADATRAVGHSAAKRRASRRDCAAVQAEASLVRGEDLMIARAEHDAADLEARILARERQLSRDRMAAFRAQQKADHEAFAQFEYELDCECQTYSRKYDQLRKAMEPVKTRPDAAAGGGRANEEALRIEAVMRAADQDQHQHQQGDPKATAPAKPSSVQCSKLGVPLVLALHAELDKKRELEIKLNDQPKEGNAIREGRRKDLSSNLQQAFAATDAILARLKGSIQDKQEKTNDCLAELHGLHLDRGVHASGGGAPPAAA